MLLILLLLSTSQAVQIIWDNNVDFDFNTVNNFEDGKMDEVRIPNWFLIFPGTKWCGAGNIADDDNDLGEYKETDKCCRTHDFCDDIIEGLRTKHNLTNPNFYTRLNCECDEKFRKCLKAVNSVPSIQVGHLYFTLLGTQCFREYYPIIGCRKYTYFPIPKCLNYEFDENKDKLYQWFDLANF